MRRQWGIAELKAFNEWRDDFLIEASTLLLIAGFILGTIDIFVGGGVATTSWFKVSWAIVQALAIDGLFFAVWGRVARAQWTRGTWHRNIPMVAVGLILALVAMLVNDILTYQQVNELADSIGAIKRLGIDVQAFTAARAILVVAVGVLVQLMCRREPAQVNQVNTIAESEPAQVNQVNTIAESEPAQVNQLTEAVNGEPQEVNQVNDQVNTVDTGEHEPLTKRQQVVYWLTDGSKTGAEIAELVNVSKSYVSKVKGEVSHL
jgi:hypothetical protein